MNYHSQQNCGEINLIDTRPIKINLSGGGYILIRRPTFEEYFHFESDWATLLMTFLPQFKKVGFLSYEELQEKSLKDKFFRELFQALSILTIQKEFINFIKKWKRLFIFSDKLSLRKVLKKLTVDELIEIFSIFHFIILSVKKNIIQTAERVLGILQTSSIFLQQSSNSVRPRFGVKTHSVSSQSCLNIQNESEKNKQN